jgi:hypothetical protein
MSGMQRALPSVFAAVFVLALGLSGSAQPGPYDPEDWPPTIDDGKIVHYVSTDAAFAPPSDLWTADGLVLLTGGDQVTEPITIGGHQGVQVTGNYLNVKDLNYPEWADDDTIDILVQVYGDEAILGPGGAQRNYVFLTGTLPELNFPAGGAIPVECKNQKWSWILFRIPNGIRPSDGSHFVGTVPANAQGDVSGGGVNGGTIRFEGVPGFKVRLVAFGELGAFGEPVDMNFCELPEECPPEPETNHVWVDVAANTSDHLTVLDGGDQTVVYEDSVGPAADKRRAVRATGAYMSFGITEDYLGQPCNDPRAVKICIEYYDDPASAGVLFGPEAYATDALGGVAFYPDFKRAAVAGSDAWLTRSWTVPAVNLAGVNTAPLTGGPRLIFVGGSVLISRVDMAVLRTGGHPLAGQDPLAECFEDPLICAEAYGSYAELNLATDVRNGLDVGTSGGDQEMIIGIAGPANDLRQAVRPAFEDGTPGFAHNFMNFALIGEPLGPSSQPNARLAICVTYYDDPLLIGASFRPEVYQVERNGVITFGFTDGGIAHMLVGSDTWRNAYFEIPEIKFNGVNQGPQAAARFALSGKIFFTRVQYAVIRPCGPNQDVNLLEDCKTEVPPEICDNDLDDDGDQAIDCADSDCAGSPLCVEICDNQRDDDADLAVDCDDTDCAAAEICLVGRFHRGDSNNDGKHNISDPVNTLNVLFLGTGNITCQEAADSNDDGKVNISDPVNSLNVLFLGTGEVPPPLPPEALTPCSTDPTPDVPPLGCTGYSHC